MTAFLVTGARAGLGLYLRGRLGGAGLTRRNAAAQLRRLSREGVDVIVHCAANAKPAAPDADLYGFVDDNILLTERLTKIPHRRFVFISTVDVYPRGARGRENTPVRADRARSLYAASKLMSEAIVGRKARRPLILRAGSLLGGRTSGSLARLARGEKSVSLKADSRLNCVLHSDVADFIALALERGLGGVYNAVSAKPMTVRQAARAAGCKKPAFGRFRYDVGEVDGRKIAAVAPAFRRTSLETFQVYRRQLGRA